MFQYPEEDFSNEHTGYYLKEQVPFKLLTLSKNISISYEGRVAVLRQDC